MQEANPFVGEIVHYGSACGCRPAIVVRIWDKVAGTSNLQVFMDGDNGPFNDGVPNVCWRTSIVHGDGEGKWHRNEECGTS